MTYDPSKHHRRSIRLKDYDYAGAGWYYVTICTTGRSCILGKILDGKMQLSEYGAVVEKCWQWLSTQYSYVDLDEYIVMPNHLHGILIIKDDSFRRGGSRTVPKDGSLTPRGDSRIAPTMDDHKKPKSLGRLIGAFKTLSTKSINEMRGTPGEVSWQRNFYEHIIRDEEDLHHIREYIANNPVQWMLDENNPDNINNDMYGRFANRP